MKKLTLSERLIKLEVLMRTLIILLIFLFNFSAHADIVVTGKITIGKEKKVIEAKDGEIIIDAKWIKENAKEEAVKEEAE